MNEQFEYMISWGAVVLIALSLLICLAWGCSAINIEYTVWKQRTLAKANIERAKGIAAANKITGNDLKVKYL